MHELVRKAIMAQMCISFWYVIVPKPCCERAENEAMQAAIDAIKAIDENEDSEALAAENEKRVSMPKQVVSRLLGAALLAWPHELDHLAFLVPKDKRGCGNSVE